MGKYTQRTWYDFLILSMSRIEGISIAKIVSKKIPCSTAAIWERVSVSTTPSLNTKWMILISHKTSNCSYSLQAFWLNTKCKVKNQTKFTKWIAQAWYQQTYYFTLVVVSTRIQPYLKGSKYLCQIKSLIGICTYKHKNTCIWYRSYLSHIYIYIIADKWCNSVTSDYSICTHKTLKNDPNVYVNLLSNICKSVFASTYEGPSISIRKSYDKHMSHWFDLNFIQHNLLGIRYT